MNQLKALYILKKIKKLYEYNLTIQLSNDSRRHTESDIKELDEAIADLEVLQSPKMCETCSKWKQHSGSIFGVCADGNRSHFNDEDTTYDYGCTEYILKDSE